MGGGSGEDTPSEAEETSHASDTNSVIAAQYAGGRPRRGIGGSVPASALQTLACSLVSGILASIDTANKLSPWWKTVFRCSRATARKGGKLEFGVTNGAVNGASSVCCRLPSWFMRRKVALSALLKFGNISRPDVRSSALYEPEC
jgi:hypothetical protein